MEPLLDFFNAFVYHIPPFLLWLGATIGHGFFWLVTINVFYSFDVPHKLLEFARKADALLILSGPVLFLPLITVGVEESILGVGHLRALATPYLVFCFFMGAVAAPIAQVRYWLRQEAPQVSGKTIEVLDLVQVLGSKPRGTGKASRACSLPFNQVFEVEFVDLHLRLPQLPPAWEGLTILHLTDLHFHRGLDRSFYRAVIDRCLAWGTPDLLCITGDIVDSAWHHRWILPILGRLRWNVAAFAILGNHDAWWDPNLTRRRLHRLGISNIGNTWQKIDVRGEPLIVVGHEVPWFQPLPSLEACPADGFRLCLSHSPDAIHWAQEHRIDLMLSGHVHGGQIRFPLLGSAFVPSRHSRRYDCGTFFETPTLLHVSRGLSGKNLIRINCRPEVTRLVLHRSE